MASFSYARSFTHIPWRNHEDVVDAEGDNGFNNRFIGLETEFDTLAATITLIGQDVDTINTGLPVPQRQVLVAVQSVNLAADQVNAPAQIDTYDNADFPADAPKLYSVRLIPTITAPHGQVSHHFVYRPGATQTEVDIWFKNELGTATAIVAHIFALS